MSKLLSFFVIILIGFQAQAQDFYNISTIKEVRIKFAAQDWDLILDSLKQDGNDHRLIGSVKLDGVTYDSVGVRYKGNSSYFNVRNVIGSQKLPFNIKFNYTDKKQTLPGGIKSLKLSNVFRDPSFLREVMSYEIAGNYMPAPKANFMRIYINDEFMGLYNNTESVDKLFLEKHFGYGNGVLFKCDPDYHATPSGSCPKSGEKAASLTYIVKDSICYEKLYELKTDFGWAQLIALIKTLEREGPDKLEQKLNVDQVLWMHAFNNVVVNLDSYAGKLCHNYYLYQDSFGIFHPILWDMNLSFGGFRYDGVSTLSNEDMIKMSPFLHYKNESRPFINKLLSNSLYRKIYVSHMQTILKDFFESGKYRSRISQIQQTIDFYVKSDEYKFYTYEAFKQNANSTSPAGKSKVIGLTELMDGRTSHLKNHPVFIKTAPSISNVNHVKGETISVSANVSNVENVFICYRSKAKAPFKKAKMVDDGTNGDATADDGKFTLEFESNAILQYYLIAEGAKTAKLSPERASLEFHEVK